jgi:hypothetical protein
MQIKGPNIQYLALIKYPKTYILLVSYQNKMKKNKNKFKA